MNEHQFSIHFKRDIDEYFQLYRAFLTAQSNSNHIPHGPKFSLDDWIGFETGTKDCFGSILGWEEVLLSYVIQDNVNRPVIPPGSTCHGKIYWNAPLLGAAFNADNLLVWTYLLHRCSKTPGWIRIQQYRATNNGRDAWFALRRNHGVENIVPPNEPSYEDDDYVYINHRDPAYHNIYDRWHLARRSGHPPMPDEMIDLEMVFFTAWDYWGKVLTWIPELFAQNKHKN